MNVIITIKPCAETANLERQGSVKTWFENGNIEMEAADYQLPEKFIISKDNFPWRHFAQLLIEAWKYSNTKLSASFTLQKRISGEIITALESSTEKDCYSILKILREAKYFKEHPSPRYKSAITVSQKKKKITEPEW